MNFSVHLACLVIRSYLLLVQWPGMHDFWDLTQSTNRFGTLVKIALFTNKYIYRIRGRATVCSYTLLFDIDNLTFWQADDCF